jgi:ferrous-iron efflux pump FieF
MTEGMDDKAVSQPPGSHQPPRLTLQERSAYALRAGLASVAVVLVLIVAKSATYAATSSASVLASLMDSVMDATASVMSYMAIRYSVRPPDSDHRHGHGKMEGLAALFQSALIAGAGLLIVWESFGHFLHPQPVAHSAGAIIVMGIAIVVSAGLVAFQNWSLKHADSLAVEADKAHYGADIIVNIGVIAVLLMLEFGAPLWFDPLFALIVAAWLAHTALRIGQRGVDMLLDRELPDPVRAHIDSLVRGNMDVLGLHDLRTHRSGMKTFISFDIELNPALSLYDSHEIVRAVELALLQDFPDAEILIHVDPYGDTADSRHSAIGTP